MIVSGSGFDARYEEKESTGRGGASMRVNAGVGFLSGR